MAGEVVLGARSSLRQRTTLEGVCLPVGPDKENQIAVKMNWVLFDQAGPNYPY